jgi:hypothetical protein
MRQRHRGQALQRPSPQLLLGPRLQQYLGLPRLLCMLDLR